MSGINPLLDTLLHHVLGKRVDTALPAPLNQAVGPPGPIEALRAIHGDAGVDGRKADTLARPGQRAEGAEAGAAAQREGARGAGAEAAPANASARVHFSPSARVIAELLSHYPAAPSALRPAAPLLGAGEADPAVLAGRFEQGVRDSGLFYESHLARWYQGRLPVAQLLSEPQMAGRPPPVLAPSAAAAGAGAAASAASAAPGAGTPPVPLPLPMPPFAPGAPSTPFSPPSGEGRGETAAAGTPLARPSAAEAQPAEAALTSSNKIDKSRNGLQIYQRLSPLPLASAGDAAPEAARAGSEVEPAPPRVAVEEGLQALVRHQLELLATPVLRWEGEAWSGLFVVLALALPQLEDRSGARDGAGGQEGGEEGGQEWHAEIGLDVAGLGALEVSLSLRERALALRLSAADAGVRSRLEEGLGALRSRLEAFGFDALELAVDEGGEDMGEGRGVDGDGR
ncbi:flagellar hook-length control protein FliK [Thauera chlorobenzoica]|uniref:Uncharacterized protein n=1 Tax=Thauera chlorobenzoica TaxID=96773 RepID=A0A1H5VZK0_9RHOO|nr:flagellar hook-length control protein FliK [Thauera chlorobenzoica]APR03291.1 hypothetical protein Tchl_0419 [Thauera chlorobenzoica]SEF92448.1 hook-length control protein FliK [Thauera chlorobenzoica]